MNEFFYRFLYSAGIFLLWKYFSQLGWEFTIYLGVFVVIIELFMRYKK